MAISYVVITPARNEERVIELTLRSMVVQTVVPLKWVIVDDGSTDATSEIVERYASRYDWITLIHRPPHEKREFASKVHSFNAGFELVKDLPYDIIANLDADLTFDADFFEFLLKKFEEMPQLGVAGTHYTEESYSSITDSYQGDTFVNGCMQLFRRECFDEIGGYVPSPGGGIDWIAVTTARMRGWTTRAFSEKMFFHNRAAGTGESNLFDAAVKGGKRDYLQGNHPLWEFFRCIYKMKSKPYLVNGVVVWLGYMWSWMTGVERPISHELLVFNRNEEMEKLRGIFKSLFVKK